MGRVITLYRVLGSTGLSVPYSIDPGGAWDPMVPADISLGIMAIPGIVTGGTPIEDAAYAAFI
jgi:hypothetical protein